MTPRATRDNLVAVTMSDVGIQISHWRFAKTIGSGAFWGIAFAFAGGLFGICLDGMIIMLTRGFEIPGLGAVLLFVAPTLGWVALTVGIVHGARRNFRRENGECSL